MKPEAPPPVQPPPTQPPTDPDPDPTPDPGPTRVYNGRIDNTLMPINADLAHEHGITGKGVTVGLLDDVHYEDYTVLEGKVSSYKDYTDTPGSEDTHKKRGHGSRMGAIIAGNIVDGWKGGVAPDAQIAWGRVCVEDGCSSRYMRDAVEELVQQGVTIFNVSIGGSRETVSDQQASALAYASSFSAVVEANGLVIASAGNDSRDEAGYPAASPVHQPHLANNWIAATAVDVNSKGEFAAHAEYANECGQAAQWCISTPGLHSTPNVPDGDPAYATGSQGTSNAAAVTTGVAALVQHAFPWMNGHNIQQTILTTATDIGDEGIDATYGWGLINAEKAIFGPAQFQGDAFVADVSGNSVFANDISGEFGLIKNGTGGLRLAGDNTFKGDTVINEGVLSFSGDTASSVIVNEGGTYRARGGKIGGDYTAYAGSQTSITLGEPLIIGGAATLDGSLHLRPEASDYQVATTENLLSAASVEGAFSDIKYGSSFFWTADLVYGDTTVDAELARASATATAQSMGTSQAVIDGAGQMDALVGLLDQRMQSGDTAGIESLLASVGSIINASDDTASVALASLTGHAHGVQRTVAVQSVMNDARMLADRLPYLASTTAPTAWAQGYHVDGELDRTGYASAEYRQDAFTIGIDVPLGGWVVGGALTKGENRADVDFTRSRIEADRVGVSAYAYKPFGFGYLSAVAGVNEFDVDSRRDVYDGTTAQQVLSSRDESSWHARLEGGLNLGNGLTPFAAVGAISHEQDAFVEDGANGLGLSAGKDEVTMQYADVGLRHTSRAGRWAFNSLLAYRDVFDTEDTGFNAWFTGAPDATFAVEGQPLPEDSIRASVGAAYALSRNVLLYGNVGLERGSEEHDNTSAAVGLRWAF